MKSFYKQWSHGRFDYSKGDQFKIGIEYAQFMLKKKYRWQKAFDFRVTVNVGRFSLSLFPGRKHD